MQRIVLEKDVKKEKWRYEQMKVWKNVLGYAYRRNEIWKYRLVNWLHFMAFFIRYTAIFVDFFAI